MGNWERSHAARFNRRLIASSKKSFPLKSIPLGEIQLRDVHVAVADTVEITMDFGSV